MKLNRKESILGVIFAIIVAIFINYTFIERIVDRDRFPSINLLNSLLFSIFWYTSVSLMYYLLYVVIFNFIHPKRRNINLILLIISVSLLASYVFVEVYPYMRNIAVGDNHIRLMPRGAVIQKWLTPVAFKHILICILNLLFVYIQRLLYKNQKIERYNEQLQLESIKSQHTALLQQINPHFFFNSLNSLKYIIIKNETDTAIEYLDNLITIFRKTLKLSSNNLHLLSEEMEITSSYLHILEKRFADKISVDINIAEECLYYKIPPLSLLTLIENITKHNKICTACPIYVKIYTSPTAEITVENTINPKFGQIESCGVGLKNLNAQYKLLINNGIIIDNNQNYFRVTMPLIKL